MNGHDDRPPPFSISPICRPKSKRTRHRSPVENERPVLREIRDEVSTSRLQMVQSMANLNSSDKLRPESPEMELLGSQESTTFSDIDITSNSDIFHWRGPRDFLKRPTRRVESDFVISKLKQACDAIYNDELKYSMDYRNYVKNVFTTLSENIKAENAIAYNLEMLQKTQINKKNGKTQTTAKTAEISAKVVRAWSEKEHPRPKYALDTIPPSVSKAIPLSDNVRTFSRKWRKTVKHDFENFFDHYGK